jgi:hypothetical protein
VVPRNEPPPLVPRRGARGRDGVLPFRVGDLRSVLQRDVERRERCRHQQRDRGRNGGPYRQRQRQRYVHDLEHAADHSTGLKLTVYAGDSGGVFGDCTGFNANAVLYSGTLDAFPAAFGPIMDPISPWTTGTFHSYEFVFSMQDTTAAQGLSATVTFIWEAQNL